jgi:hypothetical protein
LDHGLRLATDDDQDIIAIQRLRDLWRAVDDTGQKGGEHHASTDDHAMRNPAADRLVALVERLAEIGRNLAETVTVPTDESC